MDLFLVTGATGFVGSWCVKTLLDKGCRVRCTVRDPSANKCRFLLDLEGASERLELVKADLLDSEDSWRSVVRGCSVVLHTASPFVIDGVPEGQEEAFFMVPAVKGTEVVVKACLSEGVRRLVLTSSIAAILYGHGEHSPGFTSPGPDDSLWTNVEGLQLPAEMYYKSKTVAEKTAWDLVKGTNLELAVVNPGLVTGPFLSLDTSSGSLGVLRIILNKEYPFLPDTPLTTVDVRDVAQLHYLAAVQPAAAGKRHLCASSNESVSFVELALFLDRAGYDVPTGKAPAFLLKFLSVFDPKLKLTIPSLGRKQYVSATNANALMGGCWIQAEASVVDMARSMRQLGQFGRMKNEPTRWCNF
jgi:nucleoside-diphosphate-sugar epimerase